MKQFNYKKNIFQYVGYRDIGIFNEVYFIKSTFDKE